MTTKLLQKLRATKACKKQKKLKEALESEKKNYKFAMMRMYKIIIKKQKKKK